MITLSNVVISRINFIVSLICVSYNRNVVFLTESYEIASSMGQIIGALFEQTEYP